MIFSNKIIHHIINNCFKHIFCLLFFLNQECIVSDWFTILLNFIQLKKTRDITQQFLTILAVLATNLVCHSAVCLYLLCFVNTQKKNKVKKDRKKDLNNNNNNVLLEWIQ